MVSAVLMASLCIRDTSHKGMGYLASEALKSLRRYVFHSVATVAMMYIATGGSVHTALELVQSLLSCSSSSCEIRKWNKTGNSGKLDVVYRAIQIVFMRIQFLFFASDSMDDLLILFIWVVIFCIEL